MRWNLKNEVLTVSVDSLGAELRSVRDNDGCEYMWQADAKYWGQTSPVPFPICGRVKDGVYSHNGRVYALGCHGFACKTEFAGKQTGENVLVCTLDADEETEKVYPFRFRLQVIYTLEGRTLRIRTVMENRGDEVMYAATGGHPGFRVPINGEGDFSDYYIEFDRECSPDEMLCTSEGLSAGVKRPVLLQDGRRLALSHALFDNDSVFMSRVAPAVTLKSRNGTRFVRLEYPDLPYLGLWQPAKTDAPFVCIEPWAGFPSHPEVGRELSEKSDLFRIRPQNSQSVEYSITFG